MFGKRSLRHVRVRYQSAVGDECCLSAALCSKNCQNVCRCGLMFLIADYINGGGGCLIEQWKAGNEREDVVKFGHLEDTLSRSLSARQRANIQICLPSPRSGAI